MEKQISVLHYVLLALSLVMVLTSLVALHELSQVTANGDAGYAQSGVARTAGSAVRGSSNSRKKPRTANPADRTTTSMAEVA